MSFTTLGLTDEKPRVHNPSFQMSPGTAIGKTFSVWIALLVPFTLLSIVLEAPTVLIHVAMKDVEVDQAGALAYNLGTGLLNGFLTFCLAGIVSHGVFLRLRGQQPPFGDILRGGLSRLPSVLGAAVLAALLIGAIVMVAGVFMGLLYGLIGRSPLFEVLFVWGGTFFVLVALVVYWVALPVAAVERPGAAKSLRRSGELTRGNRWRIFGVLLVLGLVQLAATLAVHTVLGTDGLISSEAVLKPLLAAFILSPLTSLGPVSAAVGYHELRGGKEGIELDELVRIFD